MSIRRYSAIQDLVNGIHLRLGYVGYAEVGERWHTHLLATPFNRLYLIERGTGWLSTEKEILRLEPGKAYLLPANLPCSYECDGELSLLFFHFNLEEENRFDLMRQVGRLSATEVSGEQFSRLQQACRRTGYADAFGVLCGINALVLQLQEEYGFQWDAHPKYSRCVADAIARINRELSAQLRIDALAQACYVSRSYLARQFKKEVGMTVKEYILLQLINTAQWQLSHTNTPVERISRELGFCNQFYFSECFKKHCRVSPLQYRHGTKY